MASKILTKYFAKLEMGNCESRNAGMWNGNKMHSVREI